MQTFAISNGTYSASISMCKLEWAFLSKSISMGGHLFPYFSSIGKSEASMRPNSIILLRKLSHSSLDSSCLQFAAQHWNAWVHQTQQKHYTQFENVFTLFEIEHRVRHRFNPSKTCRTTEAAFGKFGLGLVVVHCRTTEATWLVVVHC